MSALRKIDSSAWGDANYSYDSLGNILSKNFSDWQGTGPRHLAMSYNWRDHLVSYTDTGSGGDKTLTYDARGNVKTLGDLYMQYGR